MSKPRRVAAMLELESGYKRHTSAFVGMQKYALEQGWELVIDEYADDTLPARRAKSLPYDGVIARATRKLAERAAQSRVPVVNIWLNSPVQQKLPGVFPDYLAIGQMRAEHLLSRGLNKFAVLRTATIAHELETQGFRAALDEAGYDCQVRKVPLLPAKNLRSWRKTEQILTAALASWQFPVGVFVGAEDVGRLLAQLCLQHQRRIPEDVAIIAGWNEEAFCEQTYPTLTSVDLGVERVGYESARLLDRLFAGEPPPKQPTLLQPVGLIVRQSTDFHAVDDELVAASLSFIAANSHRRIGPDAVARAVGAETRTLQLRFRKILDRPIATEIRRLRIERAKRELAHSKRPLSEIARDVGFGKSMRMYEVFRRELGVTPSAYRRERQLEMRV